jgi:hypothetical protein
MRMGSDYLQTAYKHPHGLTIAANEISAIDRFRILNSLRKSRL